MPTTSQADGVESMDIRSTVGERDLGVHTRWDLWPEFSKSLRSLARQTRVGHGDSDWFGSMLL